MEQALMQQGTAVVGLGFLGSALAAALQARGESPCTIDPAAPGATFHLPTAYLPETLPSNAFRRIFCCMATHGGDAAAYRACYLESVEELHRRFPAATLIFCSSTSVSAAGAAPASDRVGILRQAEGLVLAAGGLVARLAPLYGPGRCELLRRHVERQPRLPGPDTRMLNYLHRDDAVAALLHLAEKGERGGVYDVCGESLPHAAAYRLLEQCTGIPAVAECAAPSRRGTADYTPGPARLRALGWAPTQRLEDFFRTHSPA